MSALTEQFNDGKCDRCGGELRESPYVGGDHDEIAECSACGKHFGCWECDKRAVPPVGGGAK